MKRLSVYLVIFVGLINAQATESTGFDKIIASSGTSRVTFLELYSSESCSSCPPADQWISSLDTHKDLWKKFVPVVFHVDYWNHLNWKDELSSSSMTARQVAVSKTWKKPSVYTPSIMVNGAEWRGWRESSIENQLSSSLGDIKLQILKNSTGLFKIVLEGQKTNTQYVVHLASLGIGIRTKVTNGENSGKLLNHSFVVLDWQNQILGNESVSKYFQLKSSKVSSNKYAVVAWVEEVGKPIALQATGGYL